MLLTADRLPTGHPATLLLPEAQLWGQCVVMVTAAARPWAGPRAQEQSVQESHGHGLGAGEQVFWALCCACPDLGPVPGLTPSRAEMMKVRTAVRDASRS